LLALPSSASVRATSWRGWLGIFVWIIWWSRRRLRDRSNAYSISLQSTAATRGSWFC
jgi:hypothetical protein